MKTLTRAQLTDRRRFFAALRRGESSIGWGPQCLVLGSLPTADVRSLCDAIEAHSNGPDFEYEVQFQAEIARCAKRNGASAPDLHVRLTNAIANARHEATAAVAALILAAAPE
jgi:hypothetical protein